MISDMFVEKGIIFSIHITIINFIRNTPLQKIYHARGLHFFRIGTDVHGWFEHAVWKLTFALVRLPYLITVDSYIDILLLVFSNGRSDELLTDMCDVRLLFFCEY